MKAREFVDNLISKANYAELFGAVVGCLTEDERKRIFETIADIYDMTEEFDSTTDWENLYQIIPGDADAELIDKYNRMQ